MVQLRHLRLNLHHRSISRAYHDLYLQSPFLEDEQLEGVILFLRKVSRGAGLMLPLVELTLDRHLLYDRADGGHIPEDSK